MPPPILYTPDMRVGVARVIGGGWMVVGWGVVEWSGLAANRRVNGQSYILAAALVAASVADQQAASAARGKITTRHNWQRAGFGVEPSVPGTVSVSIRRCCRRRRAVDAQLRKSKRLPPLTARPAAESNGGRFPFRRTAQLRGEK